MKKFNLAAAVAVLSLALTGTLRADVIDAGFSTANVSVSSTGAIVTQSNGGWTAQAVTDGDPGPYYPPVLGTPQPEIGSYGSVSLSGGSASIAVRAFDTTDHWPPVESLAALSGTVACARWGHFVFFLRGVLGRRKWRRV